MIYFDNAATTRPLDSIIELSKQYLNENWYNPSALYRPSIDVETQVEQMRKYICATVSAENCIFTSCGSESANTVIFSGWRKQGGKKFHFITSMYEHPCVYECFRALEAQGHEVSYISAGSKGFISEEDIVPLVKENTALVAVMHVNNETGAVNDIVKLSRAVKAANKNTLFFADGVQAFGRIGFDMKNSGVDYYSASAHKIHGLKGTGALFFKSSTPLKPYIYGGGQEKALRSGTENTFGIFAFYEAVKNYREHHDEYMAHLEHLKSLMTEKISDIKGVYFISKENSAPYILNVAFENMRGEVLLHLLEKEGILIATGSACSSKKRTSRVHNSVGLSNDLSASAVRFSFSPFNTEEEILFCAEKVREMVNKYSTYVRR